MLEIEKEVNQIDLIKKSPEMEIIHKKQEVGRVSELGPIVPSIALLRSRSYSFECAEPVTLLSDGEHVYKNLDFYSEPLFGNKGRSFGRKSKGA